jgi:hypothetical protein
VEQEFADHHRADVCINRVIVAMERTQRFRARAEVSALPLSQQS